MPGNNPTSLPPGLLCGHSPGGPIALPPGFSLHRRLGQLVGVHDEHGNHYLLSETDSHHLLHRRVTPHANGHARNHVETGPPLGVAKED